MARVEIYTTTFCPYCVRAKRLLKAKNVDFEETNIMLSARKREEMMARADGRHTVPQIFINGVGIGGCDELHALEAAGKLDAMLVEAEVVGVRQESSRP